MGQLGLLVVTGKWPPQPSTRKHDAGHRFLPVERLSPRPYPWRTNLFKTVNGYVPPLAFPTSFNEHLFARMFFAPLPMPSLADKLAAKDYVKARLGDDFLPAVAWVGDDVGGLFAAKPPAGRYVLRQTMAGTRSCS